MNPEDRKLQHDRVRRYAIFVMCIFAVLLTRLWYLQIAKGAELLKESEMNRERKIRVAAPRGTIYDRNGRILATSRPQFVVSVVPEEFKKDPRALLRLASILRMQPEDLHDIIYKHREVPYAPARVAIDVPLDIVANVSERQILLPGVSVDLDQLRHYPDGAAVAHVMGYIGEINKEELAEKGERYKPGDFVGKDGLEMQYDSYLHGVDGGRVVEVDAMGRKTRILRDEAPIPGKSLKLGIDKDLQIAAYRAMEGRVGAAIAINPKTGEILALVNKPDYDPNVFVKGVNRKDWQKIVSNKAHPLQNRAVANKYPPGSTFKPVTATAILKYKVASPNHAIGCSGSYYFGRSFGDWKTHGGGINLYKSIAVSCNVYYYQMGHKVGIDGIAEVAHGYGLGKKTGVDLPHEKAGNIPSTEWKERRYNEKWYPSETLSCAIGQGYVQATPLQMATVAATIANDGVLMTPHLVTEVRTPSGQLLRKIKPEERGKVPVSLELLRHVQKGMRDTVASGTGRVADVEGVAIAGKTGSAEDPPRVRPHAWFICYGPFENPDIAVAVIYEQGGHGATGAAPVARAILDVHFKKKKPQEIKSSMAVEAYGD